MASSRIFIKGLPPTLSLVEFRNHFSQLSTITDAKLISSRRIGYIGYKTSEAAVKAVKYFNKSFIRMSRIFVEIAHPISVESSRPSKNAKREAELDEVGTCKDELYHLSSVNAPLSAKRKLGDADDYQFKLEEFLEVMEPPSKIRKMPPPDPKVPQTVSKIQPISAQLTTNDYDNKEWAKKSIDSDLDLIHESVSKVIADENFGKDIKSQPSVATASPINDDDEWVRNHTSRSLDLVPPEESITLPKNDFDHVESKVSSAISLNSQKDENHDLKVSVATQNADKDSGIDTVELIKSNPRLFVRNLAYTATEEDLKQLFSSYGDLHEVHLSAYSGKNKGFAHIQFKDSSAAVDAYQDLDGETFQGRLLHIIPGYVKPTDRLDKLDLTKLPFSKKRIMKRKIEAYSTSFSWNSLYMDQDAINSAIASRLGVTKADLLDPASTDSAWKQALAETSIIQETKAYFASKGVDLDSFKKRERGDTTILVKNLPYGETLEELRNMFEKFGQVIRVLMPPAGMMAIVEFAEPGHAKAAFSNLAYRRVKDSVLFLEKAPKDLFIGHLEKDCILDQPSMGNVKALNTFPMNDLLDQNSQAQPLDTSTLFVRNLNFTTTSERLTEICKPLPGFKSARVNTKKDHKNPGQLLSMGFGFLEFKNKTEAESALKTLDGYKLDGHSLVVKASHRGLDAAEERRRDDRIKKSSVMQTKIVIKNLPFEATKKDVKSLFGTYGRLRSVRLPKKFNNSTRGFAFADFMNSREAENALEALKNTHLLGRRLVLEFARAESMDAEEEIEKMQKKVTSQVNKVALQKLTGGGRKKFNIDGIDDEAM